MRDVSEIGLRASLDLAEFIPEVEFEYENEGRM